MTVSVSVSLDEFERLWNQIQPIGRWASGGYRRFAWTPVDLALREWFAAACSERGLDVIVDRAGNQWAWWGNPDTGDPSTGGPGVAIGSHLDSVPDGGAFDGPLGVVSSLLVIDILRRSGITPTRPLAVVNFSDEEGARFGVACGGSRLLTGALASERALALRDGDGTSLAESLRAAGRDPSALAADKEALSRVGCFVELHVEQGRGLVALGRPVAVGTAIWGHGRWRFELPGEANHAGTTRLADRRDPALALATLVLRARELAEHHEVRATCGKILIEPNGVNAIPSLVTGWLDARGEDDAAVKAMVASFAADVASFGGTLTEEFVRNPGGVSHSPAEYAEPGDCLAGVGELARVVQGLLG